MKSQREMINYVMDIFRTHTPGDKDIITFRKIKEGDERCPESRDEEKETVRCWNRIIYGKHGQERSRTFTFCGI